MRVYMIDRNIISKISSNFKNCSSEDKNFIKSLDAKGNYISLFLANIEGRSGAPQRMIEASFGMLCENEAVNKFFKKAKVDSNFFEIFNNLSSFGITSHQKDSFQKSSEVIRYLQDTLYQPYSLTQAKIVREKIVDIAAKHDLDIGHPIVLCGLATLYGNTNAHGVLKTKKPKDDEPKRDARIYNALADLMVMVTLAELIDLSKRSGSNMRIKFATIDKPLRYFIQEFGLLDFTRSRFALVNVSNITLEFNMALFPKLSGSEEEEFKEWISSRKQQVQRGV